jgi:hypothetical protein
MMNSTKAETEKAWTQPVDAASTLLQFRRWLKRGVSLERRGKGRLTRRDLQILQLVAGCRVLTARQIQIGAGFPLTEHDSRCQHRLKLLKEWGIITELSDRSVNEPAIYLLTKDCKLGLQILQHMWGDRVVRKCLTNFRPVDHLIGINEVRVRIARVCDDLGYVLSLWQSSKDLFGHGLQKPIPDAYFEIERKVERNTITSAYFLEFEYSTKSSKVIRRKLENYSRLVYGGRYKSIFERQITPRILFVFDSYIGMLSQNRIYNAVAMAKSLGVNNARFTTLDKITRQEPNQLLHGGIWASSTDAEDVHLLRPL